MRLTECVYDGQVHEVLCAARKAADRMGGAMIAFRAQVLDSADLDDLPKLREGRVGHGFLPIAGRLKDVLVIEWGESCYLFVQEGGLLYAVEGWPSDPQEQCGDTVVIAPVRIA